MSILDVFTFKKDSAKIFSKENFAHILGIAREEIIKQAKKAISGAEKKLNVDKEVIEKINILKSTCKNNLILWLLDRIIEIIPTVTQLIYNFLKEKIESLWFWMFHNLKAPKII